MTGRFGSIHTTQIDTILVKKRISFTEEKFIRSSHVDAKKKHELSEYLWSISKHTVDFEKIAPFQL